MTTTKTRLPYYLYEQASGNVCCSQLCEYFMKKRKQPFNADHYAFTFQGRLYLPTGQLHSSLEGQEIFCQELFPVERWEGETRTTPGSSGESFYHGVLVTYKGEKCVMGNRVNFSSELPDTAFKITLEEALQHHTSSMNYGWRHRMKQPLWLEQDGTVLATYTEDSEYKCEPRTYLHYKTTDGEIKTLLIDDLASINEYRNPDYIPLLVESDQMSFF